MVIQSRKIYVEKLQPEDLFWFVETASVNMLMDEVKRPELIDLNTLYQLSSKSMGEGTAFVAKCNGEPIGALGSILLPNIYNPRILTLVELMWYVLPKYRNTRAGALLLLAFDNEARILKSDAILSLLSNSAINTKTLEKRDFNLKELSFVKQYKEI